MSGPTDARPAITVSAVVLRSDDGAVLTVRKRGTARFMLPGGKPEPGETVAGAAVRECAEELGVRIDAARLRVLGRWTAAAANEDGWLVDATVYEHPPVGAVRAGGEIAELRWSDPAAPGTGGDVAPLLTEHVFPALGSVHAPAEGRQP